jgi:predicted acetyltransferase
MIQYSERKYKRELKNLWQRCFPNDSKPFVKLYFDQVYRHEETLIYLVNQRPVAALQMIPYLVKTATHVRESGYLSGVMTHPDYRKRGFMGELLKAAFEEMTKKNYAYTFLIPQEEELVAVYEKYGFRRCEPSAATPPPVNRLLKTPQQRAAIRQDYFNEHRIRIEEEPFFPDEAKGMIKRLHPAAEDLKALHLGMMLD